jgi:hypothetical protein
MPASFFPCYLVAFLFWIGISLGALVINMLHHVTGGNWGVPIRRVLESACTPLPLMALLFLPIVLGMHELYVWSDPQLAAADELVQRKRHYLNIESFLWRAVAYFGVWIVWTLVLNWSTTATDAASQHRRLRPLALVSSVGIVLWGLAVTFASIDWAMSIDPHWFSTMYGVLFMAGQAVSGLALAIVGAVAIHQSGSQVNRLTADRLHDLGNLLLAFVTFWSYVSFMQYLIIWSGNLPEETPWYLQRQQGGWWMCVLLLAGLHFIVPFLLLLMRQIKRNDWRLLRLAALLLGMRLLDIIWLILPNFVHASTATPSASGAVVAPPDAAYQLGFLALWPLLLTVPAIGGLWIATFTWSLARRYRLPVYSFPSADPNHDEIVIQPAP